MKEVLRQCIVTREKLDKKLLVRVVKNKNNEIFIDESYKKEGRGAYIKKDKAVILKAKKNRVLNRVFKTEIKEELYTKLIEDYCE